MQTSTTVLRSCNLGGITSFLHYINFRYFNKVYEPNEVIKYVRKAILEYLENGYVKQLNVFDSMNYSTFHLLEYKSLEHELNALVQRFVDELKVYCGLERILDLIVTEEENMCILKVKPLNIQISIKYKENNE